MAKSSHDATQTKREFSLSLMQPERIYLCAETVKEFVKLTIPAQDASSTFLHAIRKLQSNEILQTNLSGEPELLWYEGSQSEFTPAVKNLIGNVDIPDNAVYSEELRSLYEEKYRNALTRFKSDFSRTYNSFRSVIDFVIFARRPGYSGGTVSSRIGLIWLAPSDTWTDDEWLENIIHEFIHNVLFLEDMVANIFLAGGSRLEQEDALAISAIRRVKRGYDKSYHSAFVAFGIIEYYIAMGNSIKARNFLDPLLVCLDDLNRCTDFISEHGRQLLLELIENSLRLHNRVLVH